MKLLLGPLLLILVVLGTAGCGAPVDLDQPPEIIYGEYICEACGMIISDPRFAAAYVTQAEEIRLFDDIGGMFAHDAGRRESVYAYWVHDLNTQEWTRAEQATFVLIAGETTTPMGWGIAAFKDSAAANAFIAADGGLLLSFDELRGAVAEGDLDAARLHDHFHGQRQGSDNHGQNGQGDGGDGSHGHDS